jgi:hypothetical protein
MGDVAGCLQKKAKYQKGYAIRKEPQPQTGCVYKKK